MERPAPLPSPDRLRGTTLFFVPYAGVTPMLAQAAWSAARWRERGHAVFSPAASGCSTAVPSWTCTGSRTKPRPNKSSRLPALRRQLAHDAGANTAFRPSICGRWSTPDMRRASSRHSPRPRPICASSNSRDPFRHAEPDGRRAGAKNLRFRRNDRQRSRRLAAYLRSCLLSYLLVDRALRRVRLRPLVHVNDYSLLMGARRRPASTACPATAWLSRASQRRPEPLPDSVQCLQAVAYQAAVPLAGVSRFCLSIRRGARSRR